MSRFEMAGVACCIGFAALAIYCQIERRRKKRQPKAAVSASDPDRALLHLAENVPFSAKMATEGVFCCAELGWGKTWLVFQRYLRAYIRSGMGGWILGAKAEDLEQTLRLFEKEGARGRLVIISPEHANCVNYFQSLVSIAPKGAEVEEVVGGLSTLVEVEQRSASKSGGENQGFFKTQSMMLLTAIISVLRLAGEILSARNIYNFLTSLPMSQQHLMMEGWRNTSYANACCHKAHNAEKTPAEKTDYEAAHRYLFGELLTLNDRTRSSIVSTVSAMISKMLRGWMHDLWSTTTTIDMRAAFEGTWFYFDTSPLERGEYGVMSLVMAKHLAERVAMRRKIDQSSKPVGLLFDEAQAVFVTADRDFQAICRQKLCCVLAATQNITGMHAVLGGGQDAEAQIKSWIALFGLKIFGANTCWDTNTYASQLCGQELKTLASGGGSQGKNSNMFDSMFGQDDQNWGWSQQYLPAVPPEEWVRLRKPREPHYEAEAVIIGARLRELIGRHWMKVTFTPEK